MIYRRCNRCGKRIRSGSKCECTARIEKRRQAEYDRNRRDKKAARFYSSGEWARLQAERKSYYAGLDIYALYKYGHVVLGRIAHHIVPIREDWERRLDPDNIVVLSDVSHREVHDRMDSGDMTVVNELKEYQKRWIRDREGGTEKVSIAPPNPRCLDFFTQNSKYF